MSNGECDDALQFGGDTIDLGITVFVSQGAGSQSLCDAANEVGKAVGDVINSRTQMQHFTVPRNSIARLAACGLLNNTQIGNYRLADMPENPSGHECLWQPDSTRTIQAGVELLIGTKVDAQSGAEPAQIHGLPSYTVKYDTGDYTCCEVDTKRLPWGSPGSGLVEIASVFVVEGPGQIDAACTMATEMANVVWPKLPPLS